MSSPDRASSSGGASSSGDFDMPSSIVDAIETHTAEMAERRLYTWLRMDGSEEATLTFRQLRDGAQTVCCALRRRWHVVDGDRVMLIYPPGLEFNVAFFGCQYAGVVAVPYYPPVFPARLFPEASALRLLADGMGKVRRIAAACSPQLILSSRAYLRAKAISKLLLRGNAEWPDLPTHATDHLSGPSRSEREWLQQWVATRRVPADPDEVAWLQFTSGSTGHPKGVMVATRCCLANVNVIFRLASNDVISNWRALCRADQVAVVNWVPQYHDMGLVQNLLLGAVLGMRADAMSPISFLQQPICWLRAVSRLHKTHSVLMAGPDFAYALCVRKSTPEQRSKLRLAHVIGACSGAEPIRAATLEAFTQAFGPCGFAPGCWTLSFGLAENVLHVAGAPELPVSVQLDPSQLFVGGHPVLQGAGDRSGAAQTTDGQKRRRMGIKLMPEELVHQWVAIVEPESCVALPDGTVGEIWVGGASVCRGYWGLPELSAETFGGVQRGVQSNGCTDDTKPVLRSGRHLRTGDLGLVHEGRLYVVGRIKDVITLRGLSLHASDVEACAERACEALRAGCCAAFSVEDDDEELLVLMAELRTEADPPGGFDALVRALSAAVGAEQGIPVGAVVLLKSKAILKTTSGKLRRRELRTAYMSLVACEPSQVPRDALLHWWRSPRQPEPAVERLSALHHHPPPDDTALERVIEGADSGIKQASTSVADDLNSEALRTAREIFGDSITPDTSLHESGIDSVQALELRQALSERIDLGHVELPATLIFDYPTLRQIEAHVRGETARSTATVASRAAADVSDAGISGQQMQLPHGVDSVAASWSMGAGACNVISEVPTARWEVGPKPSNNDAAGLRCRHGGFVAGAERFDNRCFNVSPAEAAAMDPQQRLLLERGYEALHSAGWRRADLMGSVSGVFVAIAANDFNEVLRVSPIGQTVYAATGGSHSIASGRLSYVLGLQGPCASYDTACSSALVAGHAALRAVQLGECGMSLLEGVSLMLLPAVGMSFAQAGMTSARGRSHTFDSRADGYARGEACGAAVLESKGTVATVGSAVRQDGKSASLTAPNGQAQRALLLAALADASVAPSKLARIEAAANGSQLADPMEAGSLAGAVLSTRGHGCEPLAVGSVKANSGHAEPASGMAGLVLLTAGLTRRQTTPNAQLRVLNPHVGSVLRGTAPCALPTGLGGLMSLAMGGVSSFGYSGTIAHAQLHSTMRAAAPSAVLMFRGRVFRWVTRLRAQAPRPTQRAAWAGPFSAQSDARPSNDGIPANDGTALYCTGWAVLPMANLSGPPVPWLLVNANRGLGTTELQVTMSGPLERCRAVVMMLCASDCATPVLTGVSAVMKVAQLLSSHPSPPWLVMLTTGAQAPMPAAPPCGSAHGGCWGLARVLRLERPTWRIMIADVRNGRGQLAASLVAELNTTEREIAWETATRQFASRLRRSCAIAAVMASRADSTWLITGGLGGLGLHGAAALLQWGANRLILASRRGSIAWDGQGLLLQLEGLLASEATVSVVAWDAGDPCESMHLASALGDDRFGVLHAAGLGDAGLLETVSQDRLRRLFSAKALAAAQLHHTTARSALVAFVLFSSKASMGGVGQAAYASANSHLDAFGLSRRVHGMVACGMQLPMVAGAGMGAAAFGERQLRFRGMATISLEQYTACLGCALAQVWNGFAHSALPTSLELLQESVPDRSHPFLIEMTGSTSAQQERNGPMPSHAITAVLSTLTSSEQQAHVEELVLRSVREVAGSDAEIDSMTPLMDAGIDSLAATELSSQLQAATGLSLSSTLIFEEPTPRAVASHLVEQLTGSSTNAQAGASPLASRQARSSRAGLVVVTGRWPGACSGGSAVSHLLQSSGDGVTEVPSSRWTLGTAVDIAKLSDVQTACVAHGGFVAGAEGFDHRCFGISSAEAVAMDPQQRLLLEVAYEALHGGGARQAALLGGSGGVFVGIERPDWMFLQLQREMRQSVYTATADTVSVASGRLSFVLGLQGPCVSVDTACSSSLTALHGAWAAVCAGECIGASASAVSLKLSPQPTLVIAAAGMLSVEGRCKTWDARADGYVRSEGVGSAVVASHCIMVVGSAVVKQDGRSASLTAPNGSAQRTLLLTALVTAGLSGNGLGMVEAHGTGTALGDPTEAGSLTALTAQKTVVDVGAAKASIGHTEAASGQLGLMRASGSLQQRWIAGNSQLRTLNPMVRERAAGAARFVLQSMVSGGDSIGVSSFGYSGTIAHVMLQ